MRFLKTIIIIILVLIVLIAPFVANYAGIYFNAWGLAPSYPDINIQASPNTIDIPPGGSAIIKVSIIGQETFEGQVQLTAQNVTDGITVTFNPNPVDVPAYGEGYTNMNLTISTDMLYKFTMPPDLTFLSLKMIIVGTSKDQFNLKEGLTNIQKSIPYIIRVITPMATTTTSTSTRSFTTITSTASTTEIPNINDIPLISNTSTINTKTSDEAEQVADYTLPIIVAVAVIVMAGVVLRRRK